MPSARCGSSSDEQPLEAEHQRVVAPPLDRGLVAAGLDLGEGGVERRAARRALGERDRGVLALEHERLAREFLGALRGRRRKPARLPDTEVLSATLGFRSRERTGRAVPRWKVAVAEAAGSARRARRSEVPRAASAPSPGAGQSASPYYSTRETERSGRLRTACGDAHASPCAVLSPRLVAGCGRLRLDEPESARRPATKLARRARRRWPSCTSRRTSCSDGGARRVRGAAARAAGLPGGGEQVGLVVRAVPRRVPVLPEAGDRSAARRSAFLGVDVQRQRRRRARVPRASTRCPTRATRTPT